MISQTTWHNITTSGITCGFISDSALNGKCRVIIS